MSKDNINIPEGSIVGINYSGMHDSAVVVVGPDGNIVSAVALERYSRVKQDGRPPTLLLADLPWEKISRVAVSTNREFYFRMQVTHKAFSSRPDCLPLVVRDCFTETVFISLLMPSPVKKLMYVIKRRMRNRRFC